MELVIDGYNVIGSRGGLYGDVAAKREAFVAELGRYARLKGHAVTAVFDGFPPSLATAPFGVAREITRRPAGVRVVFAEHERADDVVIRLAQRFRENATIVSSDREVRDACRSYGCVVLGAQVFDQRLSAALAVESWPGDPTRGQDKDGDADNASDGRQVKRGNPRRLSKAERKTRKRLDRL